ncbi:MAG: phosphopantothenoylcysteine decarboxylase [Puniceicoccales bacterium]|jgi:phosphopantothenoylcysteine decarboxylase/phosphopantothenate--cysteine ligase|nr:phosphopantothenoylcysteine decarboxylase [Puniceicoccales bacterium]
MCHCLITAGPTREFFDPVRFITNPSSGKMGYALAAAALAAGCTVDLVSGPVAISPPQDAAFYPVTTGAEMLTRVNELFPRCHILIKAAAVCDFRPRSYSQTKVKKANAPLTVELEPVPDILKTIAVRKTSAQTVVGFAAETSDIERYALQKLTEKNLDLIVANKVGRAGDAANAFEADTNSVILLGTNNFRREYGTALKTTIARQLIHTILEIHRAKLRSQ